MSCFTDNIDRMFQEWDPERPPLAALFRAVGWRYNMGEDGALLDALWPIYERHQALNREFKDHHRAIEAHGEAMDRLRVISTGEDAGALPRGFNRVFYSDADRPLVIFSDHHIGVGDRHDFFSRSGNAALYSEILSQYAENGFTLVENGDVEELLVVQPEEGDIRERIDYLGDGDHLTRNWDEYDAHRIRFRARQMERIGQRHAALYEQIRRQFLRRGRYIRIAGNHDQDLQEEAGYDALRRYLPELPKPYDFAVLGRKAHPFVICHGHQFDTSATPLYARRFGEMISECLSWAFQGADRVWSWTGDDVRDWIGGEPFRNDLVSDDISQFPFNIDSFLAELLLLFQMRGNAVFTNSLYALLNEPALWEGLFHHRIAWDYFEGGVEQAIFDEVMCGEEWIKFRHLDEQVIRDRLHEVFEPDEVPLLVCGHSHEPRHRALDPRTGSVEPFYLNSGAAGRFGNLIWATEIVQGEPRVVAWSRPSGPSSGRAPARQVYRPDVRGGAGWLVHDGPASRLPAGRWLSPVLAAILG